MANLDIHEDEAGATITYKDEDRNINVATFGDDVNDASKRLGDIAFQIGQNEGRKKMRRREQE